MRAASYNELNQAYQRACSASRAMADRLEVLSAVLVASREAMSSRRAMLIGAIFPSRYAAAVKARAEELIAERRARAREEAAKPKIQVVQGA